MDPNAQPEQTDSNGISMLAIRQALMRRMGGGGANIGQAPATPMLNQVGQPGALSPATPQAGNPPTPQPQFSSPFAGPKAGMAGASFDDETKKVSKVLISKLLQVL